MKEIPDGFVDLILCDLPYGTTDCSWDEIIPFGKLWEQYTRILKPNGNAILTSSQPFTTSLINSNPKLFKYEMIWIKTKSTGFQHAKNRPMKSHEDVLVFSKGSMGHENLLKEKRMTYNPQELVRVNKMNTGGKRRFGGWLAKDLLIKMNFLLNLKDIQILFYISNQSQMVSTQHKNQYLYLSILLKHFQMKERLF